MLLNKVHVKNIRFFQQPINQELENSKHDIEFIGGVPDSDWLENEVAPGTNATIIIDVI